MADTHHIYEDHSLLSRIDQLYFRFESALTLAGGTVIFLLILFTVVNVLGRWLFNLPISGYIDWVEQAMAFFAFLGLAYTQREGGHIRMDIVVSRLRGRLLWLTEFITTLLMLLITLVLIYGSYLHFLRAYEIGDSTIDINLPTWPAKLVVPVALTVFALRLLLQLWGYARAVYRDDTSPVAVPLIENAASTAAAEAQSLAGKDDSDARLSAEKKPDHSPPA